MEEPAFLVAMQRIVGGVEVENDLLGRRLVRLEEKVDEQALDRRRVVADLVIAVIRAERGMFQPVERALAGERGAVLAPRLKLAGEGRQHRVVAQLVVVDQILVPQRDAADALHEHGLDGVLHELRHAAVGEVSRQAPYQPERPIRGAQQQRAGVRAHLPAVERQPPLGGPRPLHIRTDRGYTLSASGTPLRRVKPLSQKSYRRSRAPMHPLV